MIHLPWPSLTSPFFRFLLVGVLNTIIGLSSIFFLMNILELGYWASTFIGNGIGAVCSFLLNRSFTFKSDIPFLQGGAMFVLVIFSSYIIAYSLSPFVASFFSNWLPEREMAVFIGAGLYTVFNYVGQKRVVFTNRKRPQMN